MGEIRTLNIISIFNVDFLCSYMYVSEETPLHRWLYEDNEGLQCDGPVREKHTTAGGMTSVFAKTISIELTGCK